MRERLAFELVVAVKQDLTKGADPNRCVEFLGAWASGTSGGAA